MKKELKKLPEQLQKRLRELPAVDELLRTSAVEGGPLPRWALVRACRDAIAMRRGQLLAGEDVAATLEAGEVRTRAQAHQTSTLREVFNATGVVVHTNLGRAPLPHRVMRHMQTLAQGYSTLEYDLAAGLRGDRHGHVARLICEICAAEDAVVVNNNAAAVMLCLTTHARDREVIVSRGELVEIGGSFRMPDVMEMSGAMLREVGTTNRTHPADYERAICEQTGLMLKVHTSNYEVVGFTRSLTSEELVALGRQHGVPVMYDLGSGSLFDLQELGLGGHESTVHDALNAGFDLVTFSGDKLLGGPQAGIIVGRRELVNEVRRHPMMRALRPDKLCLAALEETLNIYREGQERQEIPVVRMLTTPQETLHQRAKTLAAKLRKMLKASWEARAVEGVGRVGGGAYPIADLPSWAVVLKHPSHSAQRLAETLRAADPPIIARVEDEQLLLDVRTLPDEDLGRLSQAACDALGQLK
ncbi:MAG: L-seryl-tRNA(Sec) selenium transferase [Deltaproteobacteria bacterium]|nr:L-seryl-tRNA(Sec) selenium transferase [Deltaproteobacteria bacterium]